MKNSLSLKLALSAVAVAFVLPAGRALADDPSLTEVDLSQPQQGQVVDVVSGVKWLGGKIGHGTKVSAQFVYNKGLKPAAIAASDLAQLTEKGSVYVALKVKNGTKTAAIEIQQVVVNGSEDVYKDALRPVIVTPVEQAAKIAFVDGAYKMILKPVAEFGKETAENDVVTGVKAAAGSERDGATAAADDITHNAQAVYEVVLKPIGQTADKVARATIKGTVKVACNVSNTVREEPKDCTATAQLASTEN